jgi:hypothetical protein
MHLKICSSPLRAPREQIRSVLGASIKHAA